jgi:hypothetical protein
LIIYKGLFKLLLFVIVGGRGGVREGYKGGESGKGEGGGKARELILRGRITAFLLRIIS